MLEGIEPHLEYLSHCNLIVLGCMFVMTMNGAESADHRYSHLKPIRKSMPFYYTAESC